MNHIRITYDYHMCYCCKCDAKREDKTERKYTDMQYIDMQYIWRPRAEIRRRMESK